MPVITHPDRLPLLNAEEIRAQLLELLRAAADLSAYIEGVDLGSNTIVVKNASLVPQTGGSCPTNPAPTSIGEGVALERLLLSRDAVAAANSRLLASQQVVLVLSGNRPACVNPDGSRMPT